MIANLANFSQAVIPLAQRYLKELKESNRAYEKLEASNFLDDDSAFRREATERDKAGIELLELLVDFIPNYFNRNIFKRKSGVITK